MKSFQDVKDDNTRYKMNEIYIHICQIICMYMSHKHVHIAKKKKKIVHNKSQSYTKHTITKCWFQMKGKVLTN